MSGSCPAATSPPGAGLATWTSRARVTQEPPQSLPRRPASVLSTEQRRQRRRLGVVGVVIVAAIGFLIFKGLTTAIVFFKTANEAVAQRATLGDSTFQLEGMVVPGTVRTSRNSSGYDGGVHRRIQRCQSRRDQHRFAATAFPARDPGHRRRPLRRSDRSVRLGPDPRQAFQQLHRGAPEQGEGPQRDDEMNAALGLVGVALGLIAAVAGVVTIGVGLATGRTSLFRPRPHVRVLGPRRSGRRNGRHGAGLVDPRLLDRVRGRQQQPRDAVALHDHRHVVGAAGLDTALVAHPGRIPGCDDPQVPESGIRPARGLGQPDRALRGGLLLRPHGRSGQSFRIGRRPRPSRRRRAEPALQDNPLIAFHPVFLYLGFVGFTVPFAFAIATLVTGRLNEGWLLETRRWTLFAWAFLTIGIVMGAWWSYQVLGWGGFWGWDPVENAALLPWLCATAYLHSVMVQERRGLLRVWNLSLLIAAFSLTILGTFLTRSGVLVSVHSFSDSTVGPVLLGFFGLVVAVGVGLIGWRGDRLRSPGTIDAAVSREGAFLVNNLLFAGFALVVLLGTVFPLFVQALNGQQVTVGRPYFDTMTLPIGFALAVLHGRRAGAPVAQGRPGRASPPARGPGVGRRRWSIVVCVLAGVRGFTPLLAFGLGAFAGASAVRQLVLSATALAQGRRRRVAGAVRPGKRRHDRPPRRRRRRRGARGRKLVRAADPTRAQTRPVGALRRPHLHLHRVRGRFRLPNKRGEIATVLVDGAPFYPAISVFPGSEGIGTPAVDSSVREDTYLTAG